MESSTVFRAALGRFSLPGRRTLTFGAIAALVAYLAVFLPQMGVHAGSSDCSGYLNQARLMAEGRLAAPQRVVDGVPAHAETPYLYVPLGFRPIGMEPAAMVPTYPTGLSLLFVASATFFGWSHGPAVVMALHLVAGIGLTFGLARVFGLSLHGSALAAAIVGLSPLYVFLGLQAMSDLPALVWVTAAVLLAEASRKRGTRWAAGAGAAFAVAVLLRPTNLLILFPVAFALGASWRRWLAFGLGGLPGAVFLAGYNLAAYNTIFTTGYGDVSNAFKLRLLRPTLLHYARWLPILLTPLVLLVFGLPFVLRHRRRQALVLGSWVAVLLGLYSVYDHTHETWWYLRFVLPAFPPLVVLALWVAQRLAALRPWSTWIAAAAWLGALLFVATFSSWWIRKVNAHWAGRHEAIYPRICEWAQSNVPANAVIVAMTVSGALYFYTDFTFVRWDHAQESDIARIEAQCAEHGRPLYAILYPFEENEVVQKWAYGPWEKVGRLDWISIWRRIPVGEQTRG